MELTLYYLTLFAISLCSTWWIFKKVLKIAKLKNIVDNPDARKLQRVPVPVLGGVAVFFGIVVALTASRLMLESTTLFSIAGVMVIMLYVGTMDDILSLSPLKRFIVEIGVVLLLVYGNGYCLDNFHGLWGITSIPQGVAVPLTVFACVGIINAINLIDGVNGLSSGYCILACALYGTAFVWANDVEAASLAILCVGALIPFFCHNVFGKKSKMFIGDGGTLMMGTVMSVFVLGALNGNSPLAEKVNSNFGLVPFCLAILVIPVFDTLRVMSARIMRGTSPFHPDKTHLHHLLFDLHFSHIGTTSVELLTNLFVVGAWFLSYKLGASIDVQLNIVIALGLLVTFGFYKFARIQERKQTKIYHAVTRVADKTHVSSKRWFESFTKLLDRNSEIRSR